MARLGHQIIPLSASLWGCSTRTVLLVAKVFGGLVALSQSWLGSFVISQPVVMVSKISNMFDISPIMLYSLPDLYYCVTVLLENTCLPVIVKYLEITPQQAVEQY